MTAKTVTFAIQIGSGGFDIARKVAEGLNYRYYDWEVTSQAAAEAGVSAGTLVAAEQPQSGFTRVMERLLAAGAYTSDDLGLAAVSPATMSVAIRSLTSDDYRHFIERVVAELGERGEAVIVGHAGQILLGRVPGVLKVLICGSAPRRAERLAVEEGLDQAQAAAAVQRSDRERAQFFRRIYHVHLLDASLYDLTLTTNGISLDTAADLVLKAAAILPGWSPEGATTESVEDRA